MNFKDLLKKIAPDMAQEQIDECIVAFDAMVEKQVTEAKTSSFNEGVEKIEEIDADYANKMESLFEALQVKHTEELEKLEEECATKMETVVETLKESHSKKLDNVDKKHAKMFDEAINAFDELSSTMLEEIVEKIDLDHTARLVNISEAYKTKYENIIVEKTQAFIDNYIAESLPSEQQADLAKLRRLEEMKEQLCEILVVNDEFVQTEVKEALADAQTQLDERQEKINQLMVENFDIRKSIKKNEAASLLEKKIKGMKPAMAAHVKQYFDGVNDVKIISSKLNEAIKVFKADEKAAKEEVIEEKRGTQIVIPDDEEPVIEESVDPEAVVMDDYVSKIHRSFGIEHKLN